MRRVAWQPRVWRYFALAVIAVGLIVAISSVVSGEPNAIGGVLVGLVIVSGIGVLLLLFAESIARTRIDVFDDHLEARVAFGRPRRIPASEIAQLGPQPGRWPGITARNARGKRLLDALAAFKGYDQLEQWMQQRAPRAWAAYRG